MNECYKQNTQPTLCNESKNRSTMQNTTEAVAIQCKDIYIYIYMFVKLYGDQVQKFTIICLFICYSIHLNFHHRIWSDDDDEEQQQ